MCECLVTLILRWKCYQTLLLRFQCITILILFCGFRYKPFLREWWVGECNEKIISYFLPTCLREYVIRFIFMWNESEALFFSFLPFLYIGKIFIIASALTFHWGQKEVNFGASYYLFHPEKCNSQDNVCLY